MQESENRYEDIKEGEFWKDTLYEILSTMDPWNIDIVKLAKEYSAKIQALKNLNFKIPANALLVCAVLLRMKSDILMLEENKEDEPSDTYIEDDSAYDNDNENGLPNKLNLSDISLIPKRILKRKISAEELMQAINDALKSEKKEIKVKKKVTERQIIEITPSADIRKRIDEIYKKIIDFLNNSRNNSKDNNENTCENTANTNAVKFSQISVHENLVQDFISLLFLSDKGKILLRQEELYGEIFIMKGRDT